MERHPEIIEDMGMLPADFHAARDFVARQTLNKEVRQPTKVSKAPLDYAPKG